MGTFFAIKELMWISLLLAATFFVLLGVRKADTKALKVFGYVVAVLLLVSIGGKIFTGVYKVSRGKCPVESKMKGYHGYEKEYHKEYQKEYKKEQ